MWRVQLSPAAADTLQTLPEEDRGRVLSSIGRLTFGPNPPGTPQPYRLRNRPDLIVLRAGDKYRVAYTASSDDEMVTVIDIVPHDGVAEYPSAAAAR